MVEMFDSLGKGIYVHSKGMVNIKFLGKFADRSMVFVYTQQPHFLRGSVRCFQLTLL